MNKKEIKKYVENDIEYHCNEFGLQREEVVEVVAINIFDRYIKGLISKEDLIQCHKYLGYDADDGEKTQNKSEYYAKHHKVYKRKNKGGN